FVAEADFGLDAIVLSAVPEGIEIELETPRGLRVKPALAASLGTFEFVVRGETALYRASLPIDRLDPDGSHAGTWYVVLRLTDDWRTLLRKHVDQFRDRTGTMLARGVL